MDIHAAIDEARFLRFHKRLAAACLGGPVLSGYVLAIIGVALVGASAELGAGTLETSLIGASALAGIFLGAPVFGAVADRIGRHLMYTVALWILVAGSVLQFFVRDAVQLAATRFLLGVAIGAIYPIVNALLAEWLPRRRRGRMLGLLQAGWFAGAALASLAGFAMFGYFGAGSWRWMLLSGVVPGAVVLLLRPGAPESARWLLHQGRPKEAKSVLRAALADQPGAGNLLIGTGPQAGPGPGPDGLRILLQPRYLRRIIFCSGFYMLQAGPLFAIYTFGPTILTALGMEEGTYSTLGSVVINLVFLAGCLPALLLVDTWGRRPLITWGFALMALPLLVLGLAPAAPAGVVFACFCAYALFSGGPAILEWAYPSELFPTAARATAVGISTAASRVGAAVGTFGLPYALAAWGAGTTLLVAAAATAAGFVLCVLLAEETRGLALQEASGG